jgi:two-component system, OmpR family, KDP operon response regulator KdpE
MATENKPTVLVIEDEASIRHFLRLSLEAENLKVVEAESGAAAVAAANRYRPDLYILDLGLPDRDGIDIIDGLRQWTRNPIIVVTARSQETEMVKALDAGADDYVTKPFGVQELMARIRVALRHTAVLDTRNVSPVVRLGDVSIDLEARRISRSGTDLHLTPTEFKLLALLAKNPGKVVTQRTLLVEAWGEAYQRETHYLRIYMKQLRQKLEPDPAMPKYLLTETGVGYRLNAD